MISLLIALAYAKACPICHLLILRLIVSVSVDRTHNYHASWPDAFIIVHIVWHKCTEFVHMQRDVHYNHVIDLVAIYTASGGARSCSAYLPIAPPLKCHLPLFRHVLASWMGLSFARYNEGILITRVPSTGIVHPVLTIVW